MPDNCKNRLTISGPDKDIERFIKENTNKNGVFSFKHSYPPPGYEPDLSDTDEVAGLVKDRLLDRKVISSEWHTHNWGTKYDCWSDDDPLGPQFHDNSVEFMTAWSPADGYWETVSTIYPSLVFMVEAKMDTLEYHKLLTFRNGETWHGPHKGGSVY